MAQTSRPAQSAPLPAVTGEVRVLRPVGSVGPEEQQAGEIELNGQRYYLRCSRGHYELFTFDARRRENRHYQLPPGLESCECLDYLTRAARRADGRCKHQKALRALIGAGKVPELDAPVDLAERDAELLEEPVRQD